MEGPVQEKTCPVANGKFDGRAESDLLQCGVQRKKNWKQQGAAYSGPKGPARRSGRAERETGGYTT
jgi:hypothetical protein